MDFGRGFKLWRPCHGIASTVPYICFASMVCSYTPSTEEVVFGIEVG